MEMNDDLAAGGVPPGFRFHPTEEELVGYYLKRKIDSLKIDLDVIVDVDLYRMEPWDIQDRCKLAGYYDEQTEWYFFSHKDKKYPTGTRTNRATASGFWKATGRDKAVVSSKNNRTVIGMRKTLVFYRGRAPNGRKTDWIVHEYRLLKNSHDRDPQEEGWVVCRAFKKPSPSTHRQQQYCFGFGFDPVRNHHNTVADCSNGTHYHTFRGGTNYNLPYNTNILGVGFGFGGGGGGGASPSSCSIPELSSPNSLSIDNTITPPPAAPGIMGGAFRQHIQSSSPPPPVDLTQQNYDKEWFASLDRVVNRDDISPLSTRGGGVVSLEHDGNNDGSGWKLLESLLASDDDDDRNNVASCEPPPAFPFNSYQHYDQSDQVGHFLAYFSEF